MSFSSICGGIIGYFLERKDKKALALQFNIIFSGAYIILDFLMNLCKLDFEELLDIYGDLMVNYTNIHIKFILSVVISVIVIFALQVKKIQISEKITKSFLASLFIVGAIFTGTGATFYMTAEAEDFFIPLLNVNFESEAYIVATIAFVVICVILIYANRKCIKKEKV